MQKAPIRLNRQIRSCFLMGKWRKSDSEIETSYEEDIMEEDTTKIGAAILIGGMIGAAIALLYAPKSGRKTRKDMTGSRGVGKISRWI